jgi:threonine dehydrogenase-like Zn-dependent dehydrogenase
MAQKNARKARLTLTDVHEYTRGATLIPTDTHSLTAQTLPVTLGHEISGVVDAIGSGVEGRSVGDRVAVQPILSDGNCDACEQGRPNCCLRQGFYGLSTSIRLKYRTTANP